MMQTVAFSPDHLKAYLDNAIEPGIKTALDGLDFMSLQTGKDEWTCLWNGEPVGSGGLIEIYAGRATAWAVVLPMPKQAFLSVHLFVRRVLRDAPYRRIEAHVDCNLWKAHEWMRLLGFTVETPRKVGWLPSGGDVVEYVRLRDA